MIRVDNCIVYSGDTLINKLFIQSLDNALLLKSLLNSRGQ